MDLIYGLNVIFVVGFLIYQLIVLPTLIVMELRGLIESDNLSDKLREDFRYELIGEIYNDGSDKYMVYGLLTLLYIVAVLFAFLFIHFPILTLIGVALITLIRSPFWIAEMIENRRNKA